MVASFSCIWPGQYSKHSFVLSGFFWYGGILPYQRDTLTRFCYVSFHMAAFPCIWPDQYSKHWVVVLRFLSYCNILQYQHHTLTCFCYVSFHVGVTLAHAYSTCCFTFVWFIFIRGLPGWTHTVIYKNRWWKFSLRTPKFRPLRKCHFYDTVWM